MARTIVNKHFNKKRQVTREQFHENDKYAKGEIIIVNDETPSIYVLDSKGNPQQISGGSSTGGGVSQDVIDQIKSEITNSYTAADNALKSEMLEVINDSNVDLKTEINGEIKKVDDFHKVVEYNIREEITATKKDILSHTVNGITINENPVLDASHIEVGNYTQLTLDPSLSENVMTNDIMQIALKKIENMAIANALAFSAALNDINSRLDEAIKRINELENNTSEE